MKHSLYTVIVLPNDVSV